MKKVIWSQKVSLLESFREFMSHYGSVYHGLLYTFVSITFIILTLWAIIIMREHISLMKTQVRLTSVLINKVEGQRDGKQQH